MYDLRPLSGKEKKVSTDEYDYYFRVCERITEACPQLNHQNNVSSCQVKKQDPSLRKVAGIVVVGFSEKELGGGCYITLEM